MTIQTSVVAGTALASPLHNDIRAALLAGYSHEFNAGKEADPFLIEAQVVSLARLVDDILNADADDPQVHAFEALITERTYQDAGFGNAADTVTGRGPGRAMTPGECLLTIEELTKEARALWYVPRTGTEVQSLIRKIGGVALQALEHYGAPERQFTPAQQAVLDQRDKMAAAGDAVHDKLVERANQAFQDIFASGGAVGAPRRG